MSRKRKITQEELDKRIKLYGKWLHRESGGRVLDLSKYNLSGLDFREANLTGVNLSWANLTGVNLSWANLSWADLTMANLREANLRGADITDANLTGANLSWVDLSGSKLSRANLSAADLRGVNLDYAVWPLWCGSARSDIKVDKRVAAQLLYHACIIAQQHIKIPKTLIKFVEKYFHRYTKVKELGGENDKN